MTPPYARARTCLGLLFAATVFSLSPSGKAATLEEETLVHIGELRAIRADQDKATIATYNKQMDNAWTFFNANRSQVLPILRAQLKEEIARKEPSDLVLLDIGLFVYKNDDPAGKSIASEAFAKLNPLAPVVKENHQELFDFTHMLAGAHDPRVLPVIEKAFLSSDRQLFVPQHAFRIDGTLACVFLYGVYGDESEYILRKQLADPAKAKRVLEILAWIGSPASIPDAQLALNASPDHATFTRVTSFMMYVGGAEGRSFMLGLDRTKLNEQSRQYFDGILPAIRGSTFEALKTSFEKEMGSSTLPDDEVSARLATMIRNHGRDDNTNPSAILNSRLPERELIAKLSSVRSSTLHRVSDEALHDVQITNLLINALRYKAGTNGG